jgi:hypothetical protein
MKKPATLLCLLVCACAASYALEISAAVDTYASINWSETIQDIYIGGVKRQVNTWPAPNVPLFHVRGYFGIGGFYLRADSAQSVMTMGLGILRTDLWTNAGKPNGYEEHQVNLEHHAEFEGQLGYQFSTDEVKFTLGVGYSYVSKDYYAMSGGKVSASGVSTSTGFNIMIFRNKTHYPFIAVSGSWFLHDLFEATVAVNIAPVLFAGTEEIDQYARDAKGSSDQVQHPTDYSYNSTGGAGVKASFQVAFRPPYYNNWALVMGLSYSYFVSAYGQRMAVYDNLEDKDVVTRQHTYGNPYIAGEARTRTGNFAVYLGVTVSL